MNHGQLHIKKFPLVFILLFGYTVYSQDTAVAFTIDTTFFSQLKTQTPRTRFQMPFDYLYHIVRTIKNLYSPNKIKEYLNKAENSLQCEFDTFPSYSYVTYNWHKKTEKTDTLTYYSGSATINLFDKTINMPRPHLENGERVTKEYFMKEFKESSFYIALAEIAGVAEKQD